MNNTKSKDLANRLLAGANSLETLGSALTEKQWTTPVLGDGRPVGVVIHHVASCYPIEIELASLLAKGEPITGASKAGIDEMNARHARDFKTAEKEETLTLLRTNSQKAAKSVERFTEEELDSSAEVSLNAGAPLTTQFFIEDHALRHSYHHLEKITETLGILNARGV